MPFRWSMCEPQHCHCFKPRRPSVQAFQGPSTQASKSSRGPKWSGIQAPVPRKTKKPRNREPRDQETKKPRNENPKYKSIMARRMDDKRTCNILCIPIHYRPGEDWDQTCQTCKRRVDWLLHKFECHPRRTSYRTRWRQLHHHSEWSCHKLKIVAIVSVVKT